MPIPTNHEQATATIASLLERGWSLLDCLDYFLLVDSTAGVDAVLHAHNE